VMFVGRAQAHPGHERVHPLALRHRHTAHA
jgi:hypothetical protein